MGGEGSDGGEKKYERENMKIKGDSDKEARK